MSSDGFRRVRSPAAGSCGIAVMAKASAPGRTKTRLVPPLTFEEAAAFNTAFLQDIAANLVSLRQRSAIRGYMAFGPPGSEAFFEQTLPRGIGLVECWFPDFGQCLFTAVQALLAHGHDSAAVLNADSPTLPASLLFEAAEVLALPGDRAVLGPAADGGYYLLGLKRAHRRMFEAIDWSTEQVAAQTLARARELGLPVHVLPAWYDVDDAGSLRMLHAELFDGRSYAAGLKPSHAAHSAALIERLTGEAGLESRLGLAPIPTGGRIAV